MREVELAPWVSRGHLPGIVGTKGPGSGRCHLRLTEDCGVGSYGDRWGTRPDTEAGAPRSSARVLPRLLCQLCVPLLGFRSQPLDS